MGRRTILAVALVSLLISLAACSGGSNSDEPEAATISDIAQEETAAEQPADTSAEDEPVVTVTVDPDDPESVVLAWAEANNLGASRAAAGLFAEGALIVSGDRYSVLETSSQAETWNSGLPCVGDVVMIDTNEADDVFATLRLQARRATVPCPGEGTDATAVFSIRDGKIAVFEDLGTPVNVVSTWAEALARGSDERAAALVAPDAIVVLRDEEIVLEGRDEAIAFHEQLTCLFEISEAQEDGARVTATLLYLDREGQECDLAAESRSVEFVVENGRIKELR